MKKLLFIVSMVFLAIVTCVYFAFSSTFNLKGTWTAPTTNADGSALTDLTGYNLYRTDGTRTKLNTTLIPTTSGTSSSPYLIPPITVSGIGTLKFVITAVNSVGTESVDSNIASYAYNTLIPSPATNFNVTSQ